MADTERVQEIVVRFCASDLTDGWTEEDTALAARHIDDYAIRLEAVLREIYPQARVQVFEVAVTPFDPICAYLPSGARSEQDEAAIASSDGIVWEEWMEALA